MATELATGYVSLVVDTAQIPKQLNAAFSSAGKAAGKRGGAEAAGAFESSMRGVAIDLSDAFGDARSSGKNAGKDAVKGLESELDNVKGSKIDLSGMFEGASDAGKGGGLEAAKGLLNGIKDGVGGLMGGGGKGGAAGAAATAVASIGLAAGTMAAGFFLDKFSAGLEQQHSLTLTQTRLGVDDATMARIGTAAGQAYAGSFGDSVASNAETARAAIQSGLLGRNATTGETQKVIEQLTTVSNLMGEDIPAVARAAGQAVKTGMAKDATDALDLFVVAEQHGMNTSEDFLDTMNEYGTQFRKLGLSGKEAVGLIGQAMEGGARDSDVAADAIKEFAIRVVDGSDTTSQAFKDLGFDADDLTRRFSAGGETARTAVGDLLTRIREIDDPLKRNQVALALFGTQYEDLGGALNNFNLDTAADSLGKVGGAAQSAADSISGDTTSKIESAKRTIDAAMTGMGAAMADAFGPQLTKVSDWVTNHQPEIIGFFTQLGSAAITTTQVVLSFASYSLHAFGTFMRASAEVMGSFTNTAGSIATAIGKITGNDKLIEVGGSLSGMADQMRGAADAADHMADGIDNTAIPALGRMKQDFLDGGQKAQDMATLTRALGTSVLSIPDGKTITLTDNTPETQKRLEDLGFKVVHLPDGTVTVIANTDEASRILQGWLENNKNTTLTIGMQADWAAVDAGIRDRTQGNGSLTRNAAPYSGESGYVHYAAGGIRQPGIADGSQAILWGEAGPEAYIPLSESRRSRSTGLLAKVAEMFGYSLVKMAAGGIVPGKQFAQSMDSATYQMGGFSTSSIDCSGMVSATVNDALGLPPFSSRMATGTEGEWLAAKGAQPGLGGPGDISVGWVNGGPGGGHTAMTLSDGTNVESNGTDGVIIGGPVGANDKMFDQFAHIPAALLRGGDAGSPTTGGGTASSPGTAGGGGSTPGSGGGLGGGVVGTGGAFDTSKVPAGVIPVWIVNSDGSSYTPSASSGGTTPQATTPSGTKVQTLQEAWDSGRDKLTTAGQGFFKANADDALGAAGLRSSGGALQALGEQANSKLAQEIAGIFTERFRAVVAEAVSQINVKQVAAAARYGR